MVSAPSRPFPAWLTLCGAALMAAMTGGCSDEGSGPVTVSVIGSPAAFATPLQNLPDAGSKLFLETTAQGLAAFDAGGQILPALAQHGRASSKDRVCPSV